MLAREGIKPPTSEAGHSELPNNPASKYSELSIMSSDDSIAMRKRLRDNLAREFDNYF